MNRGEIRQRQSNVISLAAIALEPNNDGKPCPIVRDVDAYYEDGTFYVVTYGKSNKIQQIAHIPEISPASSGSFMNFL